MNARLVAAALGMLGFVLAVSHVGVALIWQDAFRPWLAVLGGAGLTLAGGFLVVRWAGPLPPAAAAHLPRRAVVDLLILLAVALIFRPTPLPNYAGGRDDGVYTAMAGHLTRGTSAVHRDPTVLDPAADGSELYRGFGATPVQRWTRQPDPELAGRMEGLFLQGIYIADIQDLRYVFQFTHVHPLWMSIAASWLGPARMNLAVMGFGLLSVLLFYLIVHGLTGRRGWALTGGLLLAVNPLHAFFSRNALSEPTALFFLLACLLMMVWGWRLAADERQRWLVGLLAAGSFSAYCFTRIDGFFFLPFAVGAVVYLLAGTDRRDVARPLVGSLVAAVAAHAVSVAYMWATSFPYTLFQFEKTFAPLLGDDWRRLLGLLWLGSLVVAAVAIVAAWRIAPTSRLSVLLRDRLGIVLALLMLAAVAVHVDKVVSLATGSIEDQIGYIARFDLAGRGIQSAKHSSLVNLVVYLSPPVVLLAGWSLLRWRDRDPVRTLLLLLVTGYLVYGAVLQWVLPFQFYYGRYLLAGLLPFTLLVALYEAARPRRHRWLVGSLVALALIWNAAAAATQLRFRGHDDLATGMAATAAGIGTTDLVLWDAEACGRTFYQMPLIYVQDRNVWTYDGDAELAWFLDRDDLLTAYDDVYVISSHNADPRRLRALDEVAFEWSRDKHSAMLPIHDQRYRVSYQRFRLDRNAPSRTEEVFRGRGEGRSGEADGFHPDRTWTTDRAVVRFDLTRRDHRWLDIRLHGWRPGSLARDLAEVSLTLNGEPLPLEPPLGKYLSAAVIPDILRPRDNELVIETPTFAPAALNAASKDQRSLGLDIESISLR
jgi:hypothetical protein